MDRLVLCLALLASCGSGPQTPVPPATQSATPPTAQPPVPTIALAAPQATPLQETTLLSLSIPEKGFDLQIDADGTSWNVRQTRQPIDPFDLSLRDADDRLRFAQDLRETWSPLLVEHDGETLGPFVPAGTKTPHFETVVQDILIRMHVDGKVRSVTLKADFRAPITYGPFEQVWAELRGRLWPKDR